MKNQFTKAILVVALLLMVPALGGCKLWDEVKRGLDCVVDANSVSCQGGFTVPLPSIKD